MEHVIDTAESEVRVADRGNVIYLSIQDDRTTQVVRLSVDDAIELYAALDVAIDRALGVAQQEEDAKAYRWLGQSEADRGI